MMAARRHSWGVVGVADGGRGRTEVGRAAGLRHPDLTVVRKPVPRPRALLDEVGGVQSVPNEFRNRVNQMFSRIATEIGLHSVSA